MSWLNEPHLQRGIICDYITDSPEDYETERLAEPFGSPYDSTVPRATGRVPATDDDVIYAPKANPVQRPNSGTAAPGPNAQEYHQGYLAQQFTPHCPAVAQVGLIGAPSSSLGARSAYNQPSIEEPPTHSLRLPERSTLDVSNPACDHPQPSGPSPNLHVPRVPTVEELLEGVHVPTWEQLDDASRQIKELYALRALLDPQGHQRRTHVMVLPNIPSEDHRIWGGPVPLVSGNSTVEDAMNGWDSLGDLNQDRHSVHSYESRSPGASRACSLYTTEHGCWTPTSVLDELAIELDFGDSDQDPEYANGPEDEDVQHQPSLGEVPLEELINAWDRVDSIMIELRVRSSVFVFPDELDFIPPYGSDDGPLLDRRSFRNVWFVRHWEFLYRLLNELVDIESMSDRMTAAIRRAKVEVNCELDRVEEFATKLWEQECQKIEEMRLWQDAFSSEYSSDEYGDWPNGLPIRTPGADRSSFSTIKIAECLVKEGGRLKWAMSCGVTTRTKRLYWTSFPAPAPSPDQLNRPEQPAPTLRTKSRAAGPTPVSPEENHLYYYFCIDDRLLYLSFFEDWGPLNLAQVYRACILIHELLQDANLKRHRIVLYSSSDPRRRANSALLMALYCMIVQRRTPWEVFYPIAEVEFMPFRDAGRGRSDFHLGIQDCLWGVWKAQHNHLLDMNEFSVDEYEYYEKVDNGDWNWITPGFIAFASPVDSVWIRQQKEGKTKGGASALQRKLPTPFMNVLEYFSERNVKLVVRLNNELYDKAVFEERGIEHLDLYFDDGTNPADDITRTFIAKSDAIIEAGGAIAVHCKAGLGRTGTLIGAYLIYKYGFTASEAIGFMRIQFMYMKQLEWAKWAAIDEMRRAEAQRTDVLTPRTPPEEIQPMTTGSTNGTSASPVRSGQSIAPSSPRAATPPGLMSSPVINGSAVPVTPHKARPTTPIKTDAPVLQPRKTPAAKRAADGDEEVEDEGDQLGVLGVGFRRVSGKREAGGDAASASRSEGGSRAKRDGGVGSSKSDSGELVCPLVPSKRAAEIEASIASATTPPPAPKPRLISHATTANGKPDGTSRVAQATTALRNAAARGHGASSSVSSVPGNTRRPAAPPGSPQLPKYNTRSKLPLPNAGPLGPAGNAGLKVPQKRAYVLTPPPPLPVPEKGKKPEEDKEKEDEDPEWTHGEGANAVVVPGSKLERPNLRSVRRRRSSFSAADIVT
ncbi:Dual specificity protein phosphatase, N-terminal half [Rhizoctonia solani]|uniref:protein-tyrosine-phosphatase n=1 Tax=Rhizoctonia solani TaxID=456999 RepID=A0A8H7M9C7_9AGAM|nr:Dual specificity protein phosphatase, N-terminal half [Rhizoctonia solani]